MPEPIEKPPSHSASSAEGGREEVGRYLSRQRQLRGISIEELADVTKIPVRSLERLESGCFDRDSDGFVRGFVRTVADALGLDPEDTVSRMLAEVEITAWARPVLHRPRWTVAILLAALVACASLVVLLRPLFSEGPARPSVESSEPILRRDRVKELARSLLPAVPDDPHEDPGPPRTGGER